MTQLHVRIAAAAAAIPLAGLAIAAAGTGEVRFRRFTYRALP
jgi:hypothetical protein